jgi:mannose PTS system EIIC component
MTIMTWVLVVGVAMLAGMGSVLDERQFHQPLVACTLMGCALGHPVTGLVLGGSLQLIALGWMNVGAAMAPDAALASCISAVIVILSHQSIAAGIAIAIPLAVAGQVLTIFVRTINIFFAHRADAFAERGNFRGIEACHLSALFLQGLRVAIPTAAVAAVAGTDAVTHALASIPPVVSGGLQVTGGFIVVVGYAMVINMMNARKLMPFFFLGFVIAAFNTSFNLVGLGIVGVVLAIVYIQLDPEFARRTGKPAPDPRNSHDLVLVDDELE